MRILPIDPLDRVTGSCYLVHVPERDVRILVDCGAYQDGLDAERLDNEPFPFDPTKLTAVLLTHGHFDHCGRLPRLVQQGFRGPVIATEETIAIAKLVLEDAIRIRGTPELRAAFESIRWRPFGSHLFGRPLPLAVDVFVRAHRSGHILGAVSFELLAGPKERPAEQASVLFSGDVGNNLNGREVQPFLRHIMHPSNTVDLALIESTYGATVRSAEAFLPSVRRARLADAVREGLARGGPVIIPVFAVQRAQDVLWDLHVLAAEDESLLKQAPILVDGPMALRMHRVMREAFQRDVVSPTGKVRPAWLGRHAFTELGLDPRSPEDIARARAALGRVFVDRPTAASDLPDELTASPRDLAERVVARWSPVDRWGRDAAIEEDGPRVVLATGGMAEGGPVQAWLARWLTDPRATVLFPGYCAKGSLGGQLGQLASLDPTERCRLQQPLGLDRVTIRACDVQATIRTLSGYSAHADQARLVSWAFPPDKDGHRFPVARRLLVTHGEPSSRRALREAVLDHAAAHGFTMEVSLPVPGCPGIDVRTGAPVPREEILGVRVASTGDSEELSRARQEILTLRAQLEALGRASA